ncbi:reductase [Granulicella sibirica]|uniref:Reductase n=2 Tax=Granulicella sibirica TaxID=2479048 RepID=A0A4Q0T4C9_9BACT|nr:reductase [Granulicella sibirica]
MLEAAVEAGITHFDVAPSYGYGQAEACLGEVCRRHAGKLTVTSKYGIPGSKNQSLISLARGIAGPIIRRVPGLKQGMAGLAMNVVRREEQPAFNANAARTALERSLAALKTDHIDLWLLHEVSAGDLQDDELLFFLRSSVNQGKIGTFGVGSGRAKIPALLSEKPAYCPVTQYEWSVLDPATVPGKSFRIHHRALTEDFRTLYTSLLADPSRQERWSEATGHDLANAESLAKLMLKASLVANPESIILFSSKKPGHIRTNVEVAGDPSLEVPALRLHELVQRERSGLTLKAVS